MVLQKILSYSSMKISLCISNIYFGCVGYWKESNLLLVLGFVEVSFIAKYLILPNLLKLCILVNLFMTFRVLSLDNFIFFKNDIPSRGGAHAVISLYFSDKFVYIFVTSSLILCSFHFCCLVPYLYIYLNLMYHPPVIRINIKSPK